MNIYGFWDRGLESSPEIVKRCFDRWGALNPAHEVKVFDRDDAVRALAEFPDWVARLPPQGLSDILRIHLLAADGGIWVDATSLPVVALDDWLPAAMERSGFFAFAGGAWSPFRAFDNWFLASSPGSTLVRILDSEARAFWDRPRELHPVSSPHERRQPRVRGIRRLVRRLSKSEHERWAAAYRKNPRWSVGPEGRETKFYPYFWTHFLVDRLLETDGEFRFRWESTPIFSQYLTHVVQSARGARAAEHPEFLAALPTALAASPVHKLNWRVSWPDALFSMQPNQAVLLPRAQKDPGSVAADPNVLTVG